mmetsp:Transcript_34194/g.100424  ORF Transcript_34194/g.100424 Transcript_34194/m.100424 type:complete len:119 (-) Transcript_34194:61-417(-)
MDSAVLREASDEVEFYYHLLRPFVHYVPFLIEVNLDTYALADVRTNITETVRYARAHDAEVRRIARAAQELVHTHLCTEARMCFLAELLRRYSRAMTYKPSPADRPGALRVTERSQLD